MEEFALVLEHQIAIEAFCEQDEGLGYLVAVAHPLRELAAASLRTILAACFEMRPRVATFSRDDPGK
jgi:hypothetical protein